MNASNVVLENTNQKLVNLHVFLARKEPFNQTVGKKIVTYVKVVAIVMRRKHVVVVSLPVLQAHTMIRRGNRTSVHVSNAQQEHLALQLVQQM